MPEVSKKIAGSIEIPQNVFEAIKKGVNNVSGFKKNIESFLDKAVTEILEVMLGGSINLGASDIHIEPLEGQAKIRIRIDGNLQDVIFLEKKIYESILSRIKLLSELKFNISDRPQDGRFSVFWAGIGIEIRSSTLPAEHGESIVLRILNPKSLVNMEDLGLRKDLLSLFENLMSKLLPYPDFFERRKF